MILDDINYSNNQLNFYCFLFSLFFFSLTNYFVHPCLLLFGFVLKAARTKLKRHGRGLNNSQSKYEPIKADDHFFFGLQNGNQLEILAKYLMRVHEDQ